MSSECEKFWDADVYAVVGASARKPFPKITYNALKERGKTVFAIDATAEAVEGDKAYSDLASLPQTPQAVVMELPKEETADWVVKAADAGVGSVWIHQMTDTPEALAEAEKRGMKVVTGHCAVMYNIPGFSMHAPHRWIWKLLKKY
jgi:uncharacterized protein